MKKTGYLSLTEGNLISVMIRFSIPFVLSSLFQTLYSSVDIYFLGRFASTSAIAGTYTSSSLILTTTLMFIGIAHGGTILLGQNLGAGKKEDSARALGNLVFVSVVSVILCVAILGIFGDWFLKILQVPPDAVSEAKSYLITSVCGLIFVMGYNTISSVLRTLGNSKAPFIFVVISTSLNVLFDYIAVGLLHMMAMGAALATIIAQGIAFILSLLYLRKTGLPFDFSIKDCIPHKKTIGTILKVGIPLSMQGTVNNVSFLITTAMVNTMGTDVAAAVSVVATITGFCMMIPVALQSSISTMTAQNIGARKPERARNALLFGILISLCFAIPFFILCLICPEAICGIINKDPAVIAESVRYLYPTAADCILVCFVFCFNGFFNGCGKTMFTMLQEELSAFLFRIPITWFCVYKMANATIFHVGMSAPIASLASDIACTIYFVMKFNKKKLATMKLLGE